MAGTTGAMVARPWRSVNPLRGGLLSDATQDGDDLAEQRDLDRVPPSRRGGPDGSPVDADRARLRWILGEQSLLGERRELRVHRRRRVEPDGVADLAYRRRVAPVVHGVGDVVEDPTLP